MAEADLGAPIASGSHLLRGVVILPCSAATTGWGLWVGVATAAGLLAWQHSLVAPGRLERLDTAFFSANGALALLMFALYLLDMIVRA